jgi:hypothetical protein
MNEHASVMQSFGDEAHNFVRPLRQIGYTGRRVQYGDALVHKASGGFEEIRNPSLQQSRATNNIIKVSCVLKR